MFNENEHYNVENAVLRAGGNFFLNSECLFIEYNDLLGLPLFLFLYPLRRNTRMMELFRLDKIQLLSNEELFFWYLNRKNINPLFDLLQPIVKFTPEELNTFVLKEIGNPDAMSLFVYPYDSLSINKFLERMIAEEFVSKIVIYYPTKNPNMEMEIRGFFYDPKGRIQFQYGSFKEVAKELPTDTTFLLSDIMHVQELIEINHLEFSSIGIPYEYRYNFDDAGELKLPIQEFQKDILFKFNLFNAFREG